MKKLIKFIKNNKVISKIITFICVIVVIGIAMYFLLSKKNLPSFPIPHSSVSTSPISSPAIDNIKNENIKFDDNDLKKQNEEEKINQIYANKFRELEQKMISDGFIVVDSKKNDFQRKQIWYYELILQTGNMRFKIENINDREMPIINHDFEFKHQQIKNAEFQKQQLLQQPPTSENIKQINSLDVQISQLKTEITSLETTISQKQITLNHLKTALKNLEELNVEYKQKTQDFAEKYKNI
ncbi:hypothetical protein [Candidatus Phytoplasma prunorum]|uniref:hypothetical protein n=1 Tax=Candidatus Phytoplasma prunorum TaxID=47565 RepID=UPI002FEFBE2D